MVYYIQKLGEGRLKHEIHSLLEPFGQGRNHDRYEPKRRFEDYQAF